MHTTMYSAAVDARLREVLAIHFDPDGGAPYWLERAKRLGFDPREEVRSVADLHRLGTIDPRELASRRLDDFLPRSAQEHRETFIVAQTGGTLGRPAWTVYQPREFQEAFVEPFVVAARHVEFPAGGTWLYVGPSGPHIIGRAADAIARATGSMMPFGVDFDPRWARKLVLGSFAAERYLTHIVDQAISVVETQPITVLFTTPVVLAALAERMSATQRERICGVHYGGMAVTPQELAEFQTQVFPNAVHLSGYGNTLFGCCLELGVAAGRELAYYPYAGRLLFSVCDEHGHIEREPGAQGRLVFSRLDETVLLINVLERDDARLCAAPADAPDGYRMPGVASPSPRVEHRNVAAVSLY